MNRLAQLNGMLTESPKDCFLLFAIAKEHEKANDWDKAILFYEKVVENDAKYVGVYYHLGAALAETGETEKALSTYRTGIEVCKSVGDQHALSELKSSLMNLEMED